MSEAGYIELGIHAMHRRDALATSATAAGQLASMDSVGIDVAVLLPTYAAYLVHNDEIEADVSREYANAYNRWLYDLRRDNPDRLKGAAVVSCHDPTKMTADLEHALRYEPTTVVLRPNPVRGRTVADPSYGDFWRACQAHQLPVFFHEGTHARVATTGADRFESRFGQHACSHPMEAMMALLSLIEGGVLERNPHLRAVFLEAGCGWLPYWLWRLDEVEHRYLSNEVYENITKAPSCYFRDQCSVAVEPGEPLISNVATCVGPSRLVLGTDFPHLDHSDDPVGELLATGGLSSTILRKILWDNPARILNL